METSIYGVLAKIQHELRVEKKRLNKFGGFKFRNLDDIFEAFKPFADKYKVCLLINDEVIKIGEELFFKVTAKLANEKGESVEVSSYAKHSAMKKGFDDAQLSGMTSSYARKYALNALFVLDDAVDIDELPQQQQPSGLSANQLHELEVLMRQTQTNAGNLLKYFKVKTLNEVDYDVAKAMLLKKLNKINSNVSN